MYIFNVNAIGYICSVLLLLLCTAINHCIVKQITVKSWSEWKSHADCLLSTSVVVKNRKTEIRDIA